MLHGITFLSQRCSVAVSWLKILIIKENSGIPQGKTRVKAISLSWSARNDQFKPEKKHAAKRANTHKNHPTL